ncbi:hypothetical protein B0A79_23815 [Flavobacterium piscis]|uniref:DUF3892 domain-containing protein n=1 Tax=Flavobacterium piscis TaxID=1114874 RepID=A0ABX2XSL2_9FLAO|nr:DUF3892 domain-containing protein [Flavobacterium piscis]OCB75543.1 hypothetical protein FLP_08740 [Flavobacterium piscis]OXE95919.1 hypothetical protein B0A79_23815 [Flavobacterium piscis]
MANYAISGVWKNDKNVITHYAIHQFSYKDNTIGLAAKTTKSNAVSLLDNSQNSAITILWNYNTEGWKRGATITVVGSNPNKYLRSNQDGTVVDNLSNLINYGSVTNNFS